MPEEHLEELEKLWATGQMELGLEALARIGVKPRTYRAPYWDFSENTLGLLEQYGFDIDSSVAVALLFVVATLKPDGAAPLGDVWRDTRIAVPEHAPRCYRQAFTGACVSVIALAPALKLAAPAAAVCVSAAVCVIAPFEVTVSVPVPTAEAPSTVAALLIN